MSDQGLREMDSATVVPNPEPIRESGATVTFRWVPRRPRKKGKPPEVRGSRRVDGSSVPALSRLMATAIRMNRLVEAREVTYASLARMENLSRARVTQIMGLLNLAPDIQEQILHLPRTVSGHDPIVERDIRDVCKVDLWKRQREMWMIIRGDTEPD